MYEGDYVEHIMTIRLLLKQCTRSGLQISKISHKEHCMFPIYFLYVVFIIKCIVIVYLT